MPNTVNYIATVQYHEESMKMMRTAAERAGKHIPLALDTKGPEIRTGVVKKVNNTIN
jgi:pyruvate kinase